MAEIKGFYVEHSALVLSIVIDGWTAADRVTGFLPT